MVLQVFKAYRESYEEQKMAMEKRFRSLLEELLEDAIYLSAANSQLKLQIQDLKQGTEKKISSDILKERHPSFPSLDHHDSSSKVEACLYTPLLMH